MGWVFNTSPGSKRELIDERLETRVRSDGGVSKVVAHSLRGNRLWKVWEVEVAGAESNYRYIALDILSCHKGCWGYKDMFESDHPFYYDCPTTFLDKTNSYENEEWRKSVRRKHKDKADKAKFMRGLKVGEVVEFATRVNSRVGRVYKLQPLTVIAQRAHDQVGYQPKARHLTGKKWASFEERDAEIQRHLKVESEITEGDSPHKTCYQCEKPCNYLFADGRCSKCTRVLPEEV
jgi:hypothetical protein